MSSLDLDTITQLLEEDKKPQRAAAPKKSSNEPKPHEGPLGVLPQSKPCVMCARGENYRSKNIYAMYTVDGRPLCGAHAMYVLSCICVENGYETQIECKVKELESVNGSGGTNVLPGEL